MCENSTEIVFCNLINAVWGNDGEAIGLCLSSISLNPEMKLEIIEKSNGLSDKRVADKIFGLVN